MQTPEERAAYVQAQAACALIAAMGMQAENEQRKVRGESMAYVEDDFHKLLSEYRVHHNAVLEVLHA